MSSSRRQRTTSADFKKSNSVRFLSSTMVVWTTLIAIALLAVYGEISLPLDITDTYVFTSCFILLWLVGLLSLRAIRQRLLSDFQCPHLLNAHVLKAKNEWETTFDAIPNPIAIIGENYTMRRVNRAMADKLGMRPEDCVGQKCYRCIHGTDSPPPNCQQPQMFRDGESCIWETHEKKLGGDFVISVAPLYENGDITGSVHTMYDITERKIMENELRVKEAWECSILEGVGEGIYGLDLQGKVTFVNSAACRLLGYSVEELVGQSMHQMIHYQRADGIRHPDEKCQALSTMLQDKAVKVLEDIFWRKGGASFPVEYTANPVYENNQVTGCVVVFDDISARKKLEIEQLASAGRRERRKRSRSLNVLAGGIAHNFNNILMAVSGNIELLLYSLPEASIKEREFARAAMEASHRAAGFSSMMLWYVGQGNINWQVVDMRDVVMGVENLVSSEELMGSTIAYDRGFTSTAGVIAEPLMFRGDNQLIRQVVSNLVKNAAEAMAERPGKIELRAGRRAVLEGELDVSYGEESLAAGDYVFLEVVDFGIGMAAKDIEYIFEPFYTTKFTGRGLGLPFILGIIRSHNGGVYIKSEQGRGTTATILLPEAVRASEDVLPSSTGTAVINTPHADYHGTVLFVDDEESLRECNGRILQLLGFEVLMAGDGPETLEVYEQNQESISLVLLDIGLPKMDGFEVLRRLREINSAVKVIIHTGYPQEAIADKIQLNEVAGYIQEPFTMNELRPVLDKALAAKR